MVVGIIGKGLNEGITLQIGIGIRLCLPPCACVLGLAYISIDHAYAAITLRTKIASQKTLADSFKYKIAVRGLQTLTKRVLSLENNCQGFIMVEFTPLAVSTWIKKLGPSFKDALIPLGHSCIFPYHQIKVDEPLLHAAAKF